MNKTEISEFISLVANIFTIGASALALYLFFFKGKEFATAFKLLSNYAYQTTLAELRGKLDRLNEYNAANPDDCAEIINVFHEVAGQIYGNPKLKLHFKEFSEKLERQLSGKRPLTEPTKRGLVHELREGLKHLNVDSFETIMGDSK